ncbi:MAG: hypothetical protein COA54_09545 [Thiotrichaceae bacterium]|nr:MAG: hypothetical protein COA54_09545 [Thiotrichaceae bacterium]
MNPITTFDSSYEFIELHRTFKELSKQSSENDEADYSRTFGIGGNISWPDLIKENRLIILSEAGSGKTEEIRNVARMLRIEGKPAFYLRIEHISRDFEDAFEVGTYETFEEWLMSGEKGWLFLDSVDEARLRNPRDFELAIKKLSRRIFTAMDRTHIVITSRPHAWRSKSDLAYCTAFLPYAVANTLERVPQVDEDPTEGSLQTETGTQDSDKSIFKIVVFEDLTPEKVEVFVKARGIKDSKAFIDAVERADAWSFTSRPQDLEELTEFWIDKNRIGTRFELMRNSIDRRLAERDQGRADTNPLSAERARNGVMLLAAATTLTQNPEIRVPDGTENSKGIAVQSVLPDWDDKAQSTLLSRPIFDEEIYGTVRFHHSSVREYLTAEWFNELLKRETSRRTIEGLFFRNQYGLEIVVPKLRPILPWLAILNEKISERVRKVAPEIIFEGGDPSQLPLEVRSNILNEVCEKMANGTTAHSMHDYAAAQRFANPDLTDDVRELLQKYRGNDDLEAFLLRMVWLGELVDLVPEAMVIALKSTAGRYTRITAFRVIKAIGSEENQEHVRQSFLTEAVELKREWLAETIEGTLPTEQTIVWLLACLEKTGQKERFTVDHLTDSVTEFVGAADVELLPQLVTGLSRLLSVPPMIEHRYCEVSKKFQWLIVPASKAVERLVLKRHPASLESDALAILHKISAVHSYGSDEPTKVKVEFSKIIPAWKEMNRILFWFEVQRSRETLDKKRGERVTNFWQASIFGSFWRFEEDDFEYVKKEVSNREFLDDKLVGLSLAFDLYKSAKRPRKWREQLKKLVAVNNELSERLGIYLRPPAQSQQERSWKQQDKRWKRRDESNKRKQEKYHAGWKKYFNDNFEKVCTELSEKPGTITNSLIYLLDQTRDEMSTTGRWTEYNWKTLIPVHGEKVARFYRDGTVSFWRSHEPKIRSEGAPVNTTPYAVIFGLTGIEIEAIETRNWPKKLSAADVERACRYASFELNGFPTWLPKLFEMYPKTVCEFFMQEIRYELSIEMPDSDAHYVLSDVSWSGQWAWDQLATSIYELLKKEPKSLFNLDKLLKIFNGTTISDENIGKLASRKCRTLRKLEHLGRWFAVWTGVDPDAAITTLKNRVTKIADPKERTLLAMTFVTHILGGRRADGVTSRQAFKTPEHLKSLYLLMNEHIRGEEDINRANTGVFSPGLRDDAQDARDNLFQLLNQIPGKDSFFALMDIAKMHPEEGSRSWIMRNAKTKAEQEGNVEPWSPSQVKDFNEKLECTPSNHKELAELAVFRLLDLKDDLEHGDGSLASILKTVTQETEMRKYIARELRERAFGRYTITQEEELADAKRPDLRFHGTSFDGPVPVELKLADNNWGGPKLFERLENQLCGDYLRDNRSNRGVFILVYRGAKGGWDVPSSKKRVGFAGLIVALQEHWELISPKFSNVEDITVIGIDLTKREN